MNSCPLCPGLESLAKREQCERIVIQGWRYADGWRWIVDVLTEASDGHANEARLEDAINRAIGEAIR